MLVLARQIPDIDVTVVTNSLRIIQALACRDRVRIIGIGGEYSERHDDFHGPVAEGRSEIFKSTVFHAGLNLGNGVRDGSEINARLKQVMLQVSGQKYCWSTPVSLNSMHLVKYARWMKSIFW